MKTISSRAVTICFRGSGIAHAGGNIHEDNKIPYLGACQGISWQHDTIYLYGDREAGVLRKFRSVQNSLTYLNAEYKLVQGNDLINHPTGIACNGIGPPFIVTL